MSQENLFSITKLITTHEKENYLGQVGKVIWMIGLSGSGKSTLGIRLEKYLQENSIFAVVLDGDNMRKGLNQDLGFDDNHRMENVRRIAEISKLLVDNGIVVIASLITPMKKMRSHAKSILQNKYIEIFIDCPLSICQKRDVKGLYAKAKKGEIPNFTGLGSDFEPPECPDLIIDTNISDVESSSKKLNEWILKKICKKNNGKI